MAGMLAQLGGGHVRQLEQLGQRRDGHRAHLIDAKGRREQVEEHLHAIRPSEMRPDSISGNLRGAGVGEQVRVPCR